MAKYRSLVQGTRAEKPFTLPPTPTDEKGIEALIRPLNGFEEEGCLVRARERAILQGIKEPVRDEPIYDLALMCETIAAGMFDPDSPVERREPTFQSSDEVRDAYGREAIAYVYEAHQHWQDLASPSIRKLDAKQYIDAVARLGGPDEEEARRFFFQCAPGLLWSLVRSMAHQLWGLLTDKSDSGMSFDTSTTDSKSSPKTH